MEKLIIRILIKHVEGGTIAYLYNRESFDLLNIKKQEYDNSQFIDVGNIIEYEDRKLVVKRLNFKLSDKMTEDIGKYGFNMYAPTDPSDFNCQLGVFVEDYSE